MNLSARLDRISADFLEVELPEHHRAALDGNVARLVASGAAERALGPGDRVPDVELAGLTPERGAFRLREALEHGPIVLTWFRGTW